MQIPVCTNSLKLPVLAFLPRPYALKFILQSYYSTFLSVTNVETTLCVLSQCNSGHGVIEIFLTCSAASVLCSIEWLQVNDSSLTQFTKLCQCARETIFKERAGFLPIVIDEWVLYRKALCSRWVPWMLHWHFIPNHLIENGPLVGFLYTNVSFTYLNLFRSL